jgi:hypothetical protein
VAVLRFFSRVPPRWRWTLAFAPGALVMLSALLLTMTPWGRQVHYRSADQYFSNAAEVAGYAVLALLAGVLGGGVIAGASRPSTWFSRRTLNILIAGVTSLVMLSLAIGAFLPTLMLAMALATLAVGGIGRAAFTAVRGRPNRSVPS